ncbi:MAG TPA: hypothetical protein DDW85_07760 [Porphyromonadaceae bacterium]|nr:hypothetical protein [Porphyromonadaceae bacterium]
MQIFLSPAKLMNFDCTADSLQTSDPLFADKTAQLVDVCRTLSPENIAVKMKISNDMAYDVHSYFQSFDFASTPRRAAALAYNGIAYKGLNAHDFTPADAVFAQEHLNICSGLYGILRPFDRIKPYRLEFQRNISPKGYKSLYDFWQKTLNDYLADKLKQDDKTIINVSSAEYSKVLRKDLLPEGTRIIEINFLQQEADRFKQVVVHTKKARGMMSRFIIKNKLSTSEDVKAFDYEGYFFYPSLSKKDKWIFVR